jgi:hypothetical protein
MFPFSIHSDTIAKWNWFIVTPNSGKTFGCRRAFHVITSLQNLYSTDVSKSAARKRRPVTYANHPLQLPVGRCSNDLHRNIFTAMIPFPHVGKTALTQCGAAPVMARWDPERRWKDRVATARFV